MRRIWKGYFQGLYNIDNQEQAAVYSMQYRAESVVRVGKLRNGKDEITGTIIKIRGDRLVDRI